MGKEIPKHVAIIMDGNGRWAKKRFVPKKMGHRAGGQALNKLIEDIDKFGEVKHITVYAFSTEKLEAFRGRGQCFNGPFKRIYRRIYQEKQQQ